MLFGKAGQLPGIALEELRCDLGAFGEAVALESEGVAFARHVQYAILLDRLLRFPIAGALESEFPARRTSTAR